MSLLVLSYLAETSKANHGNAEATSFKREGVSRLQMAIGGPLAAVSDAFNNLSDIAVKVPFTISYILIGFIPTGKKEGKWVFLGSLIDDKYKFSAHYESIKKIAFCIVAIFIVPVYGLKDPTACANFILAQNNHILKSSSTQNLQDVGGQPPLPPAQQDASNPPPPPPPPRPIADLPPPPSGRVDPATLAQNRLRHVGTVERPSAEPRTYAWSRTGALSHMNFKNEIAEAAGKKHFEESTFKELEGKSSVEQKLVDELNAFRPSQCDGFSRRDEYGEWEYFIDESKLSEEELALYSELKREVSRKCNGKTKIKYRITKIIELFKEVSSHKKDVLKKKKIVGMLFWSGYESEEPIREKVLNELANAKAPLGAEIQNRPVARQAWIPRRGPNGSQLKKVYSRPNGSLTPEGLNKVETRPTQTEFEGHFGSLEKNMQESEAFINAQKRGNSTSDSEE